MDEKNVNQVPQPAQPVTPGEPAQPTEPVQPVAEPTQPVAQPAQPTADPTQPVAQPAQPAADPTQPVNPYASSQPATPEPAPASNPYQQAYSGGAAPAQPTQPVNPYAAPSPVAPPDGAQGQVPPYGQPPMGQPVPPYGQPQPAGNGKATGALICGIAAIILCWLPLLSVILGIVAIVLAGSYVKSGGTAGTAKGGRICGIVGIVLAVLMFIGSMVFGMAVYSQVMDEIDTPAASVSSSSSNSAPSSSLSMPSASRAYPEGVSITEDERVACDVVGAEMEKLRNADPAVVSTIAALIEDGFYQASDLTLAECGVDPNEVARLMLQDFDYQASMVLASSDGTGFVAYDVKVRDIFDVLSDFGDKLDTLSNSPELSSMTQDQAKARIGELFIESIKGADMEDDGYFSVDIAKSGSTWSMVQSSWDDEIDYFFGVY